MAGGGCACSAWKSGAEPIGPRKRVPEERDPGRGEGEQDEQDTDQADGGEGQPRESARQAVIFERPPFKEKDDQHGNMDDHVVKIPLPKMLGKRVCRDGNLALWMHLCVSTK